MAGCKIWKHIRRINKIMSTDFVDYNLLKHKID